MTDFLGKVHARDVKVKVKICTLLYSLSITSMRCQGPGCCSFFWWWLLSSACWCSTGESEKGFCFEWWSFLIGRDASRFTFQTFTWMRRNPHVGSIQPDLQERVQAQLLRMSYYEKKHFIWERRGGRLQKKQMHLEGSAIWVTLPVFVSQKLVRTHRSSPFDSGLP